MRNPYRATLFLTACALLLFLTTESFSRSYVGGVIYTRDGRRIEVLQFLDPMKKDNYVISQSGKEQVKVPIGKLKELNLLTADVNYIYPHSKLTTETGMVSLVYRDGRSTLLSDAYFEKGLLSYVVLTNRVKKEEQKIKIREIVKIQFDSAAGNVRVCPIDQAAFPDDYVFCPYHGVPLTWGSPKN